MRESDVSSSIDKMTDPKIKRVLLKIWVERVDGVKIKHLFILSKIFNFVFKLRNDYKNHLINKMRTIIGICGPKGVGKSFVKDILVQMVQEIPSDTPLSIQHVYFAKTLKEHCTSMFNLEDECYNPEKKEVVIENLGCSPRDLMQGLGSMYRELSIYIPNLDTTHQGVKLSGNLYLTHKYIEKISQSTHPKENLLIIIDDVRYDDEYDYIRREGGHTIKIERKGYQYSREHPSECGCSFDSVVFNDDSVTASKNTLMIREQLSKISLSNNKSDERERENER